MKKIYLFFSMLFFTALSFAQVLSGHVKNEKGEDLPGVTIHIKNTTLSTVSDDKGKFLFESVKEGNYILEISLIGYENLETKVIVSGDTKITDIELKVSDIMADEVIVTALRADSKTPVAYTNIEKEQIDQDNQGRDIPYLLDMTPSIVVTSDAGTGIGYTSMRIRGTDITRINVTLDGIPLNDSESHGVFWVNMPDFASSVDNIQIQRGVGTSTNGAAAFGANVNFVTNIIEKNNYANLSVSAGSFNTQKYTLSSGTGLIKDHFVFDVRLSKIHSDGYVDRSRTDLESYYISGAYIDKKNFFKLNIFRGHEETYQAWYGIPKDSLKTNRTYNPYTYDNEIDYYTQDHYQIFYTRTLNRYFDFNAAFHYTQGKGYYEQYKEDEDFIDYNLEDVIIGTETVTSTDLIRRKWLDNDFFGTVYSLNYHRKNLSIIFGGAWNRYDGDHFGRIIWAEYASNGDIRHEWYNNKGVKVDLNEYLKMNYHFAEKLNLWFDIQYRVIDYNIDGIHDDLRDISQNHSYNFFNPKAGINIDINQYQSAYFSFAMANREPSRSNFRDADRDEVFHPEKLSDYEAGYKFTNNYAALNINLYFMDYKNQLILTGEINDVGAYIMSNVPESYRAGIELSGGIELFRFLKWNMNVTYSQNKIKDLTVYVDNWDTWGQEKETYDKTDISFSPDVIAGSELSLKIFKGLNTSLISKYVGRQFIDNTSNTDRSLEPYLINNLRINYSIKTKFMREVGFNLFINNIFNEEYESNAWVYRYYYGGEHYVMDGFFPQAGINFMAGIDLKF